MKRHWNYRVIECVTPDGEPWRAIYEVHYEDNKPVAYSEDPASIVWDTDEGEEAPKKILALMATALDKPVLVARDFQKEAQDD